jgi:glycosyltransferase involved in cell wall biosynthesis
VLDSPYERLYGKLLPVKLAVVIPICNEQDNLLELHHRLTAVFDRLDHVTWQVIYVDDGSRDDSVKIILDQNKKDPRFTLLQLSRNFGPYPALSAGLAHADADAVITMDGDLQDPPEIIPDLVGSWKDGAQVVLALRRSRQERGVRRLGLDLFHRLFRMLNDFEIPANAGIFGLFDRQAVQEFNNLQEKNRFVPGLRCWIGFEQRVVYYDRQERAGGESKQNLYRLVRLALDAIFSFSYKPLRLMTLAGIFVSAVGFFLAAGYALRRLLGIDQAPVGFTTLVTLLLFIGGIQLIAIGLLGEYLRRIYDEVKRRPLYIVKQRYGVDRPQHSGRGRAGEP